jgi:hypothetical protein
MLLASSYDQSKYFKAADLPVEKKVRIKHVAEELVGTNREKKLVVYFTNDERGLVLNRTINRTLRGAFGDACDGWVGKVIVLFPTEDDFRGKTVPVIRVRVPTAHKSEPTLMVTPAANNKDLGEEVPF